MYGDHLWFGICYGTCFGVFGWFFLGIINVADDLCRNINAVLSHILFDERPAEKI
jgi:hypothetical protein